LLPFLLSHTNENKEITLTKEEMMTYVCAALSTSQKIITNYYGENIKPDIDKKDLKPFKRPLSMYKVLH